jgi:Ca2+-binding EF-hand superfamily protein
VPSSIWPGQQNHVLHNSSKNGIFSEHGKIEFKEFREFLIKQYQSKSLEAQARESFRIFDRDGNGTIDRKELK